MPLIDTHTHLNLGDYDDRKDVVERALAADIIRMVTPGVTLESCFSSFSLAEDYPGLFFSGMGIHPQEAHTWTASTYTQLKELSQHPTVVAIGETGLDYYWDTSPQDIQHTVLRAHIRLAKERQLPLILHVRDKAGSTAAYDDLLRLLREEDAQEVGGVMHCFSGDLAFAEQSIELGFYLAFGGVLTFKNAKVLHEVAQTVDLQHVVIETDAPWLTPAPFRGKRNEPAYVRFVADKLAELRNLPVTEIARITTANAQRLFRF